MQASGRTRRCHDERYALRFVLSEFLTARQSAAAFDTFCDGSLDDFAQFRFGRQERFVYLLQWGLL